MQAAGIASEQRVGGGVAAAVHVKAARLRLRVRPRLHARAYCFRHSQLTPTMLWSNGQSSG